MYSVVCGTERDYSYLSQIGHYQKFHDIFFGIFRRVLFQLGVPPQDLDDNFLSKDDIDHMYKRYMQLTPRPGLTEMFQILRAGGFDIWACSDASVERVKGYFQGAGVQIADDHIISADIVGKGKPEAAVYKLALEKVDGNTPNDVAVFAGTYSPGYLVENESDKQHRTLGTVPLQKQPGSKPRTQPHTNGTSALESLGSLTLSHRT